MLDEYEKVQQQCIHTISSSTGIVLKLWRGVGTHSESVGAILDFQSSVHVLPEAL